MADRKGFVKTDTILDQIMAHKAQEVAARKRDFPQVMDAAGHGPGPRDFASSLQRDTVALIAEVKKASPSKGVLVEVFDPAAIGKTYADNGAAAISVLTDERFFQGCLDDLTAVRGAVSVPVLRKEFVIDPYQVYEGRAAGADAILLIVAALEDARLAELHGLIVELGMAALVEVHDEAELERAFKVNARLIGVNNRDLKTFEVDMDTTTRLAKLVPDDVTLVAESGIQTADDVRRMGEAGVHAVLVGESLVRAGDVARQVRELSGQPRRMGRSRHTE